MYCKIRKLDDAYPDLGIYVSRRKRDMRFLSGRLYNIPELKVVGDMRSNDVYINGLKLEDGGAEKALEIISKATGLDAKLFWRPKFEESLMLSIGIPRRFFVNGKSKRSIPLPDGSGRIWLCEDY